jgi:hypothetical protein
MEDARQLVLRAETVMLQAELAGGADREARYSEAKDLLIHAESLEAGSGAWLMACLNARMDNAVLCQKWLERAHAAESLPPREDVANSPYFQSVRTHNWFVRFYERLEA